MIFQISLLTPGNASLQRLHSFFTDHIAPINLSKNLPFLFTAQNNLIKMFRVLFLLSDLSDQSDFARSNATEPLDEPVHFHLVTFSLRKISSFEGFFPAF